MHIQNFFQNFLKLFLVGLHDDCTVSLIAQDMSPFGVFMSTPLQGKWFSLLAVPKCVTLFDFSTSQHFLIAATYSLCLIVFKRRHLHLQQLNLVDAE